VTDFSLNDLIPSIRLGKQTTIRQDSFNPVFALVTYATMASIITKSPSKIKGRQSMGGSAGLVERKENAPGPEQAAMENRSQSWKGKKRAAQSIGGKAQLDAEGIAVPLLPLKPLLSPKASARRKAVSTNQSRRGGEAEY
jgi:hypothetical protein